MITNKLFVSWITAQEDGTEHAVTDEAQVAGMRVGSKGIFEAVCGARFLAACMDVGPLRRCPYCRARTTIRDWPERMNRPNWFSQLFCHRPKRSADVGDDDSMQASNAPPSVGARHRRGRHSA